MLKLISLLLIVGVSFQANLLADYHWNGNYNDQLSNANNAIPGSSRGRSDPTFAQGFCSFEQALSFTNDWVYLNPALVDGASQLAVTFWLKTNTARSEAILSGATSSKDNHFLIFKESSGQIVVYIENGIRLKIGSINNDNVWHHIAFNKFSNGALEGFIDGVMTNSSTTTKGIKADELVLGQEQDSVDGGYATNQALDGLLGQFRIYDAPLSLTDVQNEILQKYQSGVWSWRVVDAHGYDWTQHYSTSQLSNLQQWCQANCYTPGTNTVTHPACLSSSGVHQRCFWEQCLNIT